MPVTLSEAAARHVNRYLAKRGKGVGVRLGVKTTGCSGLAYTLEYVDELAPEDVIFEGHGVKVLVDPKSLAYIDGTQLDWLRQRSLLALLFLCTRPAKFADKAADLDSQFHAVFRACRADRANPRRPLARSRVGSRHDNRRTLHVREELRDHLVSEEVEPHEPAAQAYSQYENECDDDPPLHCNNTLGVLCRAGRYRCSACRRATREALALAGFEPLYTDWTV